MENKVSLEKLKEITRIHFHRELDMMEMILHLDKNDAAEFRKWYIAQPYVRGIGEIQELCQATSNKFNG